MEDKKYIQLPALDKNISTEELLCLWEFAKLPENRQKEIEEQLEEALQAGSIEENHVAHMRQAMQSGETAAYMSASRAVIKQAMTEACKLAAFVYHECFVFGISAEELKTNFPGYEDYIDVTIGYINQLFEKCK